MTVHLYLHLSTEDIATIAAGTRVRHRSPWRVGALCLVTCGLYGIAWFGLTWAEIQRAQGGETRGMRPAGLALAMLVPGYGLVRLHAHYQAVAALLACTGLAPGAPPRWVLWAGAVWGLLLAGAAGLSGDGSLPLAFAAVAALAAIVVHGQVVLNAYRLAAVYAFPQAMPASTWARGQNRSRRDPRG